jgi:hypothetical protein
MIPRDTSFLGTRNSRMKYYWLIFVAGAVLTWGAYVVTIDHGRKEMAQGGVPPPIAAMRAFLFIGLAYFVMGVVVPVIYLWQNRSATAPGFHGKAVTLSTIAGLLGAGGALCIVFAVGYARRASVSPAAVASLVFCFAPIVNVLISMFIEPPAKRPSPLFFVGILMAAVGAGMVLYFKPEPKPHAAAHPGGFPVTTQTATGTPAQVVTEPDGATRSAS